MADIGIKKVIIYKSELPPVDGTSLEYNLRYRISTENKNRVSAWSNIVSIGAPTITTINYTVSIRNTDKIVQAVWDAPASLGLSSFDLFARWVGQHDEVDYAWSYVGRVNENTKSLVFPLSVLRISTNITEEPKKVRLQLQRPIYTPVLENYPTATSLTLFQSNLLTL